MGFDDGAAAWHVALTLWRSIREGNKREKLSITGFRCERLGLWCNIRQLLQQRGGGSRGSVRVSGCQGARIWAHVGFSNVIVRHVVDYLKGKIHCFKTWTNFSELQPTLLCYSSLQIIFISTWQNQKLLQVPATSRKTKLDTRLNSWLAYKHQLFPWRKLLLLC